MAAKILLANFQSCERVYQNRGRSLILLAFCLCFFYNKTTFAGKIRLSDDFLNFRYLEIDGPAQASCTHSTTNSVDWEVRCKLKGGSLNIPVKELKYTVHLVLSYYPLTNEGFPAYELLYWVSQTTNGAALGDSVSQWIYLDSDKSKIKKLQTRLGIENDRAYLQLQLNLIN